MRRGQLPTEAETELMSRGQQATHAARRRLIAKYQGEYDRYIREERAARGLPVKTQAQVIAEYKQPRKRWWRR